MPLKEAKPEINFLETEYLYERRPSVIRNSIDVFEYKLYFWVDASSCWLDSRMAQFSAQA